MTKAPRAPYARSGHMKPNRSCPGVPNRYSLISWSMVMQPKSSATVVVVLAGTWPVRSMSAATEVIAASVVSGGISEITETAVVLPTPKPPAMTIFTGTGGRVAPGTGSADGFESTDYPLDQGRGLGKRGTGNAYDEISQGREVGHEYPGHADVQAQFRGHLGDRQGGGAQRHDVAGLEGELPVRGRPELGRDDLRLDFEGVVDRLHPPGGEQVRAQPRHAGTVGDGDRAVVPGGQVGPGFGRGAGGVPGGRRHGQWPLVNLSASMSSGWSTVLARLAETG